MTTQTIPASQIKVGDTLRLITGDDAIVVSVKDGERDSHISVEFDSGWASQVHTQSTVDKVVQG
jgi:hypothetical protein